MNNNATGTISTPHSPISLKVTCKSHTLLSEKHMTGKAGAENTEKTIQNLVHDIKKLYIENQRSDPPINW